MPDLPSVDAFTRIRQTVRLIPKGNVASYGQVADLSGLPGRARMVSKALKSSRQEPPLPWHRVLRANGQIAFPAGSEDFLQQQGLLQEEGVVVIGRKVSMQRFQWRPDLSEILQKLQY